MNVTETATIGGTITAGDKLYLSVHDPGLSQAEVVSYSVQSTDTTTSIASAVTSAINADSTLASLGVSATSSGAVITISSSSVNATKYTEAVSTGATETIALGGSVGALAQVSPSQAFAASPTLASGANTASVTAVSGGGTATTDTFPVTISSATAQSFSSDSNGNLTNVTAGSYPQRAFDAENRVIKISYDDTGDNYSTKTYDGLGHCIQIQETRSGSVTSTRNYIYCGDQPCEVRDASNNILNQYFALGQENVSGGTGTPFFYEIAPPIDNVVGLTNSSGSEVTSIAWDPWGNAMVLAGTTMPDFGFAHMLWHQPSSGNFTMFRDYDPALGRWTSRDPLGERAGVNLYGYVGNNPINFMDPLGLCDPPCPPNDLACWLKRNPLTRALMIGIATAMLGEVAAPIVAAGSAVPIANPVPQTLARVIPAGIPLVTLGTPASADVFVTDAEVLQGLNSQQISITLTIQESPTGYNVVEFPTPESGLASPVFRTDAGFVGGGQTAGGAPEFVIPNGPIPPNATIRQVQ